MTVATGPAAHLELASITVPIAGRAGFGLEPSTSATSATISSSSSTPIAVSADTSADTTSPPSSSTTMSCWVSSPRTACGSAAGRSILLMATMIGTPAARAWSIASAVCGMTPSSAATTMMAMSVTLAPRARNAVNASCPGVSMKVIVWPSLVTW